MRYSVGRNPKRFISNLSRLVFTENVLKALSVTGKKSNAVKDAVSKPALDANKLNAILGKYKPT